MPRKITIELVKWQAGEPSGEDIGLVAECELHEGIEAVVAQVFNGTVIASDPEWALVATPTPPGVQVHIEYTRE